MKSRLRPSRKEVERVEEEVFDVTVEACQDNNAFFLLALNAEFGFGPERMKRMVRKYNEISDYFAQLRADGMTYEDTNDRIREALDSIGIDPDSVYTGKFAFYEVAREKRLSEKEHIPTFREAVEAKALLDKARNLMNDSEGLRVINKTAAKQG